MSQFNWYPLESGTNNLVDCIIKHETDLYVGGMFSVVGGITTTGLAKWNGNAWSAVNGGVLYIPPTFGPDSVEYARVRSISVYDDHIFIGGTFNRSGSILSYNISKLEKNTTGEYEFVSIPGLGLLLNGTITPATIYKIKNINGTLYVCGNFNCVTEYDSSGNLQVIDNVNKIVTWNSTENSWENYSGNVDGTPTDITWFLNNIHIEYGIEQLGQIIPKVCEVYKNKLYVGGEFTSLYGTTITNLASTSDKINWSSVGGGFAVNNVSYSGQIYKTRIESLFVYEDELYVGGNFNRVGSSNSNLGIPVLGISKWNGNTWFSLGIRNLTTSIKTIFGVSEENSDNENGLLNVGLYIGGSFPAVPNTLANNIALYTDSFIESSIIGNEGVPCKPIFPCGYSRKVPIKSADAILIPGPQGPPGPEGPQGPAGLNGLNGENGEDCTVYAGILKTGTDPLAVADWGTQYRSLPKNESGNVDTSQLSDCDCYMDFGSSRKMYFYDGAGSFGGGAIYDTTGGGGGGDIEDCNDVLECIPCLISSDIAEFNYPKDAQNNKTFTIQTISNCNIINATATQNWIIDVSHNSNKTITFSVEENSTIQDRIGFIDFTVSNQISSPIEGSIIIKQKGINFNFIMLTGVELFLDGTARWKYSGKPAQPNGISWNIIDNDIEIFNIYNIHEMLNTNLVAYGGLQIEAIGSYPNTIFKLKNFGGFELKPIPIKPNETDPGFVVQLFEINGQKWFTAPNPINGTCQSQSNIFDELFGQNTNENTTDNISTDF